MRRVAITGMGIVSCIGNNTHEVLESLQQGRSGIQFLPERKSLGFRSALAGTIKDSLPPTSPSATSDRWGRDLTLPSTPPGRLWRMLG